MRNKTCTRNKIFSKPGLCGLRYLCAVLLVAFTWSTITAQTWQPIGSPGFSAGGVGYTSMAIDGSGTPYVVYVDTLNSSKATVMKYNGSSWVTVGSAGVSAGQVRYTSIAIDASGTPYVAYADYAYSVKATVMKYNGSSWVTVGLPGFTPDQAPFTSIAIDGSGTPYLVYDDYSKGQKATIMKYDGSSWVVVGVAGISAGEAFWTSIAIDGSGVPYVVYQDLSTAVWHATVMKYNGSSWVTVGSPRFSAGEANYTAIAMDGSGTPYVVYEDVGTGSKATVMKYNGSSWVNVGSAGFSPEWAFYTSIAIDGGGIPYVAFNDYNSVLMSYVGATVMKYNGSSWVLVGSGGFSGGQSDYTSIAINGSGVPYVVYADASRSYKATVMVLGPSPITGTDTLCTTHSTTLSDTTSGGTWSSGNTSIATVGSTGIVTGISAGTVTISYAVSGISVTDTVTVSNCGALGVNELHQFAISGLYLYPNPCEGKFTVKLSSEFDESVRITITNLVGQKIKEITAFTNQDVELAMDGPPGLYLLTAITAQGNWSKKIIVNPNSK